MTPMMKQYQEMKTKYQDCILFFRLGDFYEMFFDDAIEASRLLQLTLTARNKGEHRAPMCGIPYHAANNYIAKLTKLGKKVAICEQLSDPNLPGIVKRDVIRVITPGTTLDDNILQQKSNNYLLAVAFLDGRFGLAYCDLSTGDFYATEVAHEKDFMTELERIAPSEIVIPAVLQNETFFQSLKKNKPQIFFFSHDFFGDATETLKNLFQVQSLEVYGLHELPVGTAAAALLIHYLQTTQKTDLAHIRAIKSYQLSEFMPLDEATLKNLELTSTLREGRMEGSLLWVLDQTVTSMGGRFLRYVLTHPLLKLEQIRARLDAIEDLTKNPGTLEDIRNELKEILDLERLLARLSLGHGNARDLLALKVSLQKVPNLQKLLAHFQSLLLKNVAADLDPLPDLVGLIEKAITEEPPLSVKEGGMIKEGFRSELDELKKISREGKSFIQSLQVREIERTGINSLKVRYNHVFGYYIEVSKANFGAVPADYIRKQTLVNAERFITPELKEYEEKVLGAEEKIIALEYEIFSELRENVVKEIVRIQQLAHAIAQLDCFCSLATVALGNRYCKPNITNGETVHIEGGRHPVVEKMSFASQFVPNDTLLNHADHELLLITGPNMGGKSTYLRQVALITLMAHIGSFVPAQKAEICLTDRIFTRVGASDNLVRGQSTFMVEMQETAYILHHATSKSLVILDEIGRGTSTYDGMSIAWAITEYLHDRIRSKTLFATHYHELISLTEKLPRAKNFSVAVKENEHEGVVFLYKIVPGGVDRSYGIEVAKLAGLPRDVISKAKQILVDLEEGVLEQGIQKELTDANKRVPEDQLKIFEDRGHQKLHPTVEELKKLNLDAMTPIDALNTLAALKKKIAP